MDAKTDIFTERRKTQFRLKLWSSIIAWILGSFIHISLLCISSPFLDMEPFDAQFLFIWIVTWLIFTLFMAVGFLAGSVRIDGNAVSLISRMDTVERETFQALLGKESKEKPRG